jgi:2-polyprenyl-3-methyl-5-hydroxy-6-metoxy-1,4-benzoquinol methylase
MNGSGYGLILLIMIFFIKTGNKEEASQLIDKLVNYLKIPNESFILDAACGRGRHSIALAAKGFNVTGVDLSSLRLLKQKNMKRITCIFFCTIFVSLFI